TGEGRAPGPGYIHASIPVKEDTMQQKYRRDGSAFVGAQGFLIENADVMSAVNETGARAALDDAIDRLSRGATEQEASVRTSKGAPAQQEASGTALLRQHCWAVAGAARLLETQVPALAGLTR